MKPNLLILFIVILSANLYSALDPVFEHDNGQIGSIFFRNHPEITVAEQAFELEFFKKRHEVYCRFKVEYHLTNTVPLQSNKTIRGTFDSNCGDNIQIHHNNRLANKDFSQEEVIQIDTVDSSTTVEDDSTSISEQEDLEEKPTIVDRKFELWEFSMPIWRAKSTTFEITFNPNKSNILVVTGIIKPEQLSSVYDLLNPVRSRHHFFGNHKADKDISFYNYSNHFTGGALKKITYTVIVPNYLTISSPLFPSKDLNMAPDMMKYFWGDTTKHAIENSCTEETSPPIKRMDNKTIYTGALCGDSIPREIRFGIQRKPFRDFFVGGPKIGFGKNHRSENFTMRLGWESGLDIYSVGVLTALEYETDFRDENTAIFSVYSIAPALMQIPITIGGGVGLPYDINNKQLGLRLRYEFSGMLLGISGAHDYFPESDEWRFSLFGEFTF